MCGLAGFLDLKRSRDGAEQVRLARAMADALTHRGPDDGDAWADASAGVALGHRRLAIIDLSAAGHQPMHSASGRSVIAYNGEIYNAAEIRTELQARGVAFRGHSDTEVLLEACEAWGVQAAVERMIGMFAFALWSVERRELTLCRDRFGIKPLYWGRQNGLIFFASELKSLFAHPDWRAEVDRTALTGLAHVNYVPAPRSIYAGIAKLTPGVLVTIDAEGEAVETPYWDSAKAAEQARRDPLDLSDREATDRLEDLLKDAIGRRMVADVPLGALLSGGVDSSTVVALMQAQSTRPVNTFSIGFDEGGFNEAPHASAVAKHLGTNHHELIVRGEDALAVVPRLSAMYDEPFADSSQIPTHLVCALARRHVTVSLSGDGGDELFAGYNRHVFAAGPWRRLARVPMALRRLGAGVLGTVRPGVWDGLESALPKGVCPPQLANKAAKLATMLDAENADAAYLALVRLWKDPASVVAGGALEWGALAEGGDGDVAARMQLMDTLTYLPDDILAKVDRASMAVSLENRVPLIDHRVFEFAWRLPLHQKIRDGRGKWILRQVLDRHVPGELIDRPKMGFGIPLGEWLRGPLRDWAEDLLSVHSLNSAGLFNAPMVRAKWARHVAAREDASYALWSILMATDWYRHWLAGGKSAI